MKNIILSLLLLMGCAAVPKKVREGFAQKEYSDKILDHNLQLLKEYEDKFLGCVASSLAEQKHAPVNIQIREVVFMNEFHLAIIRSFIYIGIVKVDKPMIKLDSILYIVLRKENDHWIATDGFADPESMPFEEKTIQELLEE